MERAVSSRGVLRSEHYRQIREGGATSGFHLTFVSRLDSGKKVRAPKKGDRYRLGLEKAMAKGKPGAKRGSATKRRRCVVCGKFGHEFEGCWLLDKRNNMEEV